MKKHKNQITDGGMEWLLKKCNECSVALFNKDTTDLDPKEAELLRLYIYDVLHPQWAVTCTRYGDTVEVNQTGTVVRDPVTKKEYKIYYPIIAGKPSYPLISIKNDKRKNYAAFTVHRLVAQAFVPNDDPINKTVVHHINQDKTFPWRGNLEWVTQKEHKALHADEFQNIKTNILSSKQYSTEQLKEVCELLQDRPDLTYEQISEKTGVSLSVVGYIYTRKHWTQISKDYDFSARYKHIMIGEDHTNAQHTNDQIRQVCELLVAHPDWTYEKIGQETNVSSNTVKFVYQGRQWKQISKDYDFPPRQTQCKGEDSPVAKYSNDQIRYVCQLLQDHPDWRYKKISAETGISINTIGKIYNGDTWTHITKDFIPFPPRESIRIKSVGINNPNTKCSEDDVREICKLLDENHNGIKKWKHDDIAKTVGVSVDIVRDISRGKTWINISKDYVFYQAKFNKGGI